jgi:hypothetical protein
MHLSGPDFTAKRGVMKKLSMLCAIACLALAAGAGSVSAAPITYTSDAAFTAATLSTPLTLQSFEGAPTGTATSLDFGNVTFSCQGTTFCPGFFGQSSLLRTDGSFSVFFATADTGIFTFASPITAFGIDVIGLGDVGETSFFIDNGTGPLALETNYSAPGGTVTFAGITDAAGFTTVSFTGLQASDGVFFDRLRFGGATVTAVPEPLTLSLFGTGVAGAIALRRRKKKA